MRSLFSKLYDNRRVLVTGHTGFKGSWLTLWLTEMGAQVIGFSLEDPPTTPSNFVLANLGRQIVDVRGDVRDYAAVLQVIKEHRPELVIHFAAQTTVIPSYADPKYSFDVNAGGTVNVLEAIRQTDSVKALVVCTTDKVYENKEWVWGYRENDQLGGHDPYSTSKAMAELATISYRRSFYADGRPVAIATVRAGNVIGGGDFTAYGLIADSMRALIAGQPIELRSPSSVRPWQYVLEPLSGYLCVAARLLEEDGAAYADAWNFGPLQHKGVTTQAVVERLIELWGDGNWRYVGDAAAGSASKPHETHNLHLNWDKAAARLSWRPAMSLEEALAETVTWYKAYRHHADMNAVGRACLHNYVQRAQALQLDWTCP